MKIYLSRFCKKRLAYPPIECCVLNSSTSTSLDPSLTYTKTTHKAFLKATFILLFLILSQLTFSAYAQNITLKKTNSSLSSILKNIESQTQYVFFYKKAEISRYTNVTVDVSDVPLKQALAIILKGRDLQYQIFDKTIAIKKVAHGLDIEKAADSTDAQASIKLRGRVLDENSLPIKKALISESVMNTKTSSGDNGEFTLQGGSSGKLILTSPGFAKKIVSYSDTTFLDIIMEKTENKSIDLTEVQIKSNDLKDNPTKFVNMENRTYMNLAQILQGTVPGLTLQVVNTSTKTITSVDYASRNPGTGVTAFVRYSVEDFLNTVGKTVGQNILDVLLKGTNVPKAISDFYKINTITTIANVLVPEIRGANNFSASASNMLVVIDGFPQDGFPANYPMTNVESIEVIKDPKELIKWGARATGGAILIRSKPAKAGDLKFNYTSSLYYTPKTKFSRSNLKLANSAQYLGYLKSLDSTLAIATNYAGTLYNLSPAKQLLRQKALGLITVAKFNSQWDSLSRQDNESQLNMLSQNAFNENHALTVSGGGKLYKFTAIGNYIGDKTNDLGNHTNTYSFSLANSLNLLKNKLHITWRMNYANANSKSGYNFSPTNSGIEPYQLLLDANGNYAYDYTAISAAANQTITKLGYKNFGVNVLQDNTVNSITSKQVTKQSNFNMNWDLLPGLSWSSSVFYTGRNSSTHTLYGAESSYVRQLVDQYGQYSTASGVNFYVPYGNILQASNSTSNDLNVRSGLNYVKTLGKHEISAGVGAGLASTNSDRPAYLTQYGYNTTTGTGTPIYLPTTNGTNSNITNFYSVLASGTSSVYPYILTTPNGATTSLSRNLNGNASVGYRFSDRISATGTYNEVLSPLYGQNDAYSTSSSYKANVTGRVVKNWTKFIKDVLITSGVEGLKMPNLPAVYSNIRYQQAYYNNNYAIWVNGATPTQQQGQSSKKYFEKLTMSFLDSALVLNGAYNVQTTKGNLTSLTGTDSANNAITTKKFLSAGADLFIRKKVLNFHIDYSKSPEGLSQYNGSFNYYLSHEPFFKSKFISDLEFNASLQNISPYQGLQLMQGTNVASNGSYSQATNNDFTLLPPNNKNIEGHGKISVADSKYTMDLRYYNRTTSGLNNNLIVATDPTTGLNPNIVQNPR